MRHVLTETPYGPILGSERDGCIAWLGVRYATALRFGLPSIVGSWAPAVYDATSEGTSCPQAPNSESSASQSEDCLFVNIWTPASVLPNRTFAFIHGGGFTAGSIGPIYNGYFQYDGCRLAAERGIAVMTMQYRLGSLGWLAKPIANLGLRDQAAALRFTRRLLGPVAGSRVLLGGQSVGGVCVCAHLFAPESQGLFDAVLIMGGNICKAQPRFIGETIADGFLRLSPCQGVHGKDAAGEEKGGQWGARTMACLRSLNVSQVLALDAIVPELEEEPGGGWRLRGLDSLIASRVNVPSPAQAQAPASLYRLQMIWSPQAENSSRPLDAAAATASPFMHLGAPARVPVILGEVSARECP